MVVINLVLLHLYRLFPLFSNSTREVLQHRNRFFSYKNYFLPSDTSNENSIRNEGIGMNRNINLCYVLYVCIL